MEMNHVLVVEDDKEIREGVEIYLKSQGYEVFQAADGVEGLEVIEKEDIHLAIVDIMMPRMTGCEAAKAIRALPGRPDAAKIPIIAMTANAFAEDVQASLAAGMDAHLSKPFVIQNVLETISRLLVEA